jgi:hypothetical protein
MTDDKELGVGDLVHDAQHGLVQNRSHAVMAQRNDRRDSRAFYPTHGWITRALLEHIIGSNVRGGTTALSTMTCLEPACGEGHMVKPRRVLNVRIDADLYRHMKILAAIQEHHLVEVALRDLVAKDRSVKS